MAFRERRRFQCCKIKFMILNSDTVFLPPPPRDTAKVWAAGRAKTEQGAGGKMYPNKNPSGLRAQWKRKIALTVIKTRQTRFLDCILDRERIEECVDVKIIICFSLFNFRVV